MLQLWREGFLKSAYLAAMTFCGGCAVGASTEQASTDYVAAEVQIGSASPVVSESRIDSVNRYLSTVMVTTTFFVPKQGTKVKTCTGVLVQEHVVLTAGHCVCDVRKPVPPEASDTTVTDSSVCAKTADVTLLRYESAEETTQAMPGPGTAIPPAANIGPYRGTVQAHEDLRIIYKDVETSVGWTTNTEFSNADLAVVVLDESLRRHARPIKLSEEPVHLKDRVVLVGYGSDVLGNALVAPVRRYGENTVVSIKNDGSTFHIGSHLEIAPAYSGEKPGVVRIRGSYAAAGDSGGPCFRERKGALELVGIARSTHGPPVVLSVYTSTHAYLGWLRQKIASARSGSTD
ncbi:trypsin-like serine protease [Hyalangium sp.]|uniref:trypsin-like serine protease n=1 Tax=Hyalangium sp. TaxID=2028555 RepID=UPI002D227466|nr:trypsin-like serine protease [Hyalangium sp.]HYH96242.1 trypsin-like serine protease [Hyalangium sp.]